MGGRGGRKRDVPSDLLYPPSKAEPGASILSCLRNSRKHGRILYPAGFPTRLTPLTWTAVNVQKKKKVDEDKVFRNGCIDEGTDARKPVAILKEKS